MVLPHARITYDTNKFEKAPTQGHFFIASKPKIFFGDKYHQSLN